MAGGLTLDYLHVDGEPLFIECNPRIVEPGNAAAAGVDLPALAIALSAGRPLPDRVVVGRAGVRTRSALALAIGAAQRSGTRRAVARVLLDAGRSAGDLGAAAEVLTPVRRDPLSLVPVAVVAGQLLVRPARAAALARGAVESYSVTPQAIALVRATA